MDKYQPRKYTDYHGASDHARGANMAQPYTSGDTQPLAKPRVISTPNPKIVPVFTPQDRSAADSATRKLPRTMGTPNPSITNYFTHNTHNERGGDIISSPNVDADKIADAIAAGMKRGTTNADQLNQANIQAKSRQVASGKTGIIGTPAFQIGSFQINRQIVIAVVVITGITIFNNVTQQKPITKVIIGSYILLILLALLDMFGGPFSEISGAIAMLALVYVIVTQLAPNATRLWSILSNPPTPTVTPPEQQPALPKDPGATSAPRTATPNQNG